MIEQDGALRQASGHAFYNTSKFTLRDLRARASQQQLRADFEAYLDGFSSNVQDILENFEFRNQIPEAFQSRCAGNPDREDHLSGGQPEPLSGEESGWLSEVSRPRQPRYGNDLRGVGEALQ